MVKNDRKEEKKKGREWRELTSRVVVIATTTGSAHSAMGTIAWSGWCESMATLEEMEGVIESGKKLAWLVRKKRRREKERDEKKK